MAPPPKSPPKSDPSAGKVAPGTLTDTKIVGTDTGTGGFEIDSELETMDPGASDTRATYGSFSRGDINVDNTQKDISKVTLRTLGQYLGKKTRDNEYPVDSAETSQISVTSDKGLPSKLALSSNGSQFNKDLPSSFSPEASSISGFRKGKADPLSDVDGNRLLPEAVEKGKKELSQTSPLRQYTSAVLGKNRFTPEKAMASTPLRRYRHTPESMGKYEAGDAPPSNVQDMSRDRMAQIGPALSMRAGIELLSGNDGFNPSSFGSEAGAILPGVAQLGVRRIDNVMLSAADVMDNLYTDEAEAATTIEIDPMGLSWGTMNNTSDQFSGASALGMAALSAALVVGVEAVIELLSAVLSGVGKGKRPTKDSIGRYTLGSYMTGQKPKDTNSIGGLISAALPPDLGSLLGLRPTRSQFSACIKVGSRAFFGIKSSGGILSGIAGAAAAGAMSENPGYNAVICRAIIRSGVTIIDAIKHIGGNLVSIAKGIVGMLDVLKSSKIISAINVFAQLGDHILNSPDEWVDNVAEGNKVSAMDAAQNTNAVNKSRLAGTLKLAWAANRAPSVMLLPRSIIATRGQNTDAPSFGIASNDDDSKHEVRVKESRLSQEEVDVIEAKLDAEYVPFYFHDLRTNEVISFHAFLESISDDYTANYESSEGFGRVDPVKVYKNTVRKIGVSFHVVATSQMDFDDMWIKLNKLTTLVYPQYTAGRMITNGSDYTIRQPFSQLIGASPMIRLRLGDLFKSNYSKFALARLFGMGEQNVKVDGKEVGNLEKFDDSVLVMIKNEIERAKRNSGSDLRFHVESTGNYPLSSDARGSSLLSITSGEKSSYNSETFLGAELPHDLLQVKIISGDDGTGQVIGEVEWNPSAIERYDVGIPSALDAYKKIYGEEAPSGVKRLITGRYTFPVSALQPTQASIDKVIADKLPKTTTDYATAFHDFMIDNDSSKGNAIARSFRTVGGKGLAGFIDSMNYDWFSQVSWETTPDRAAPQMCKVTLTFSPIHDISPGIDSSGFNRAPVYPVGPMSPRKVGKIGRTGGD